MRGRRTVGVWQYHIGTPLLLAAAGIGVLLACYAWRHRAVAGARSFMGMMAALVVWCFTGAMEFAVVPPELKILCSKWQYLGVCAVTPFWFTFALGYANLGAWLTRRRLALLWALPVTTVLMAFTNEWHHAVWSSFKLVIESRGAHVLVYGHGPMVWAIAAYAYLLLAVGSGMVLRTVIHSPRLYQRQAVALILATLAPWVGNILYLSGNVPWPGVDPTPFAFTASAILMAIGVFRFQLLNLAPVAHDALFEGMQDGAMAVDGQGRIVDINRVAVVLLGVPEAAVGRTLAEVVAVRGELASLLTAGDGTRLEVESHWDRETRWNEIRVSSLCGNRGLVVGRLIWLRDITAAKRSEERLIETQTILASAMEQSPAGIILIDAGTLSIRIVNEAARDILGIGTGAGTLAHEYQRSFEAYRTDGPKVPEDDWPTRRVMRNGVPVKNELVRIRRRDGSDRWIVVNAVPMRGRDGRVTGGIAVFTDITGERVAEEERRELAGRLTQLEKLEGLGVLAGGIAHDYNNILMTVLGNIDLALDSLPSDASSRVYLDESRKAAMKATELTRQVMVYSGKCSFMATRVNLNDVVSGMEPDLRGAIPMGITLSYELSPNALPLVADVWQLRQAILNLVLNATESFDKRGGAIRVATGMQDCTSKDLDSPWLVDPPPAGRYVYVEIQDTGVGMDAATLDRLFEPFFSTKFIGRGMGLPAVLGVVRGHGGSVWIESAVDRGTTVRIYLPVRA